MLSVCPSSFTSPCTSLRPPMLTRCRMIDSDTGTARSTPSWTSHDGAARSGSFTNDFPIIMEATETEIKSEQAREETPLEAFASICTVLVIGLFALTFIFQNFEIPSSSMEKTLLVGDHVLVDRITLAPAASWAPFVYYRDPRRGDIIVFFKPGEPDLYLVKRVIGITGYDI